MQRRNREQQQDQAQEEERDFRQPNGSAAGADQEQEVMDLADAARVAMTWPPPES